jgi:hypothetical protein
MYQSNQVRDQKENPSLLLAVAGCRKLDWGQLATPQWEGGAFYYIGLADLVVQGKDNSLDLHLLPMVINP